MNDDLKKAEGELKNWAHNERLRAEAQRSKRDNAVFAAYRAGVNKHRIHELTGIARTTIDRILSDSHERRTDV
jgi:hypothetical protein